MLQIRDGRKRLGERSKESEMERMFPPMEDFLKATLGEEGDEINARGNGRGRTERSVVPALHFGGKKVQGERGLARKTWNCGGRNRLHPVRRSRYFHWVSCRWHLQVERRYTRRT